jgi:addiction module HigA family antidote
MVPRNRPPTHPGEVLLTEFLRPAGMTQLALAERLGVPVQRVNTLVRGKRGVSAETALLLAQVFDTTPEFWMNLQNAVDLYEARKRIAST